jgi:F420-non-reducing hydrogenase iron-sulfur subunit
MTVKRVTFVQELLRFIGLEGRVHLAWISSAEAQKFVQVVSDFTEKIRALGPNPLPGLAQKSTAPGAGRAAGFRRSREPESETPMDADIEQRHSA